MSIDKKIINEIERYNKITNYIIEQEDTELPPLPDEGGDENLEMGVDTETNVEEVPEPVDVDSDPDVEVVGDESVDITDEGGVEELDITDLVTTQKDISDKQDEYMENMFSKLDDLTSKLGEMDTILNKINDLEQKVEKYRQKSPEEKLQLRSLDSYPYNQKLTDFFMDKQDELEQTGKNEYVLTSDDVESYSDGDIKKSFDKPFEDEDRL
jgi:hypothetical protein